MYEERVEKAAQLHKSGYNCAQAVTAAFADIYGMDEKTALLTAASFGGGIGKMRQTCGAACGMFILAGLETGTTDPKDNAQKNFNYNTVQELAAKFKEANGSMICGELLGLVPAPNGERLPKKKPCTEIVRTAATIFAEYLSQRNALQE